MIVIKTTGNLFINPFKDTYFIGLCNAKCVPSLSLSPLSLFIRLPLSVSLSISIYLSIYLSVYLFVCVGACMCIYMNLYVWVRGRGRVRVEMRVCVWECVSACVRVWVSVCVCVCVCEERTLASTYLSSNFFLFIYTQTNTKETGK